MKTQARDAGLARPVVGLDLWVMLPAVLLVAIGVVMVGSASIAVSEGQDMQPYHYVLRHCIYVGLGVALALSFRIVPIDFLQRVSRPMMLLSLLALLMVFIPGIGHTVNGSTRWVRLGFVNFQVVEAVKLMVIIYLAGYLARKADLVRTRFFDTLKPLLFGGLLSAILLVQPDMGSAAVIIAIIAGLIWLAGAAWRHIAVLGMLTIPVFGFAAMEPYRLRRIVSFMDPWADPFNSGFQLTQALIAVGRGELLGVGLGASIQKLLYLPEAHTDFIFAVLAEEFGLVGVVLVMGLYLLLVTRIMVVGILAHRRGRPFAGFLAFGVGLWLGLQAMVSIGVNLGVLPTKGLTLPLISSGGSSILMTLLALGMVLRIKFELDLESGAPLRRRTSLKRATA
ncbi:putative lipid II flippase FtsW [Elongatibacter sediminis]|uniref:Probable peptidoglycan glycosyltransferase FtsW n=1 Tax=Elongatibacter sediminis TaxID=3119006 RepID=A0AAW9RND9_9GAMM